MKLELTLERHQLAILVLHMNIMRKSVKKGFKANYGLLEGRKKLKLFEKVKEKLAEEIDNEEVDIFIFDLLAEEVDMLSSFLNWYVQELELQAEVDGLKTDNNEILNVLREVRDKAFILDEAVTEEVLRSAT